jgi:hypothetical protein
MQDRSGRDCFHIILPVDQAAACISRRRKQAITLTTRLLVKTGAEKDHARVGMWVTFLQWRREGWLCTAALFGHKLCPAFRFLRESHRGSDLARET